MFAGIRRKSSLIGLVALSIAVSSFVHAAAYSPAPGSTNYVPISVDDLKTAAKRDLAHAKAAARITTEDADKIAADLDNASSISAVEESWGDLLAKAQVAKNRHPSIDHLITTWTAHMDDLVKKNVILASATDRYKERLKAIYRIKKMFYNNDHFYDFWEYTVMAIDLSSLNDRLERALVYNHISVENLNDLILRTDYYVGKNQVCARALTTYKSFEVEPDQLQQVEQNMFTVLKDKAHSRLATPEVREQLFHRLVASSYEGCSVPPTEADLDKGIAEVQRLLDSGARNGNLSAGDGVRIQHELNLVKEFKKAYPGPNPGVDLVERELRKEEVRFMSIDVRMMQDWLGRVLRADGETVVGREQILRLVRRLDLAMFSHRITEKDVAAILAGLDEAIKASAIDNNLVDRLDNLEGSLDMMVSDFSLQPADTGARMSNISSMISNLKNDQSAAAADKDRIGRVVSSLDSQTAAKKYGMSVVAASELEMVRKRVNPMLRAQGTTDVKQEMHLDVAK